MPSISVIMPAYNAAAHVSQAIDSILAQTFGDFEFVIVNDGSSDETPAILAKYSQRDSRIRIFAQPRQGIIGALNRGIAVSSGDYFARMDADDISKPNRLERQVRYMQSHREIDICGTWVEFIGDRAGEIRKYPAGHDEIYARMLFENALAHPAVMLRASALRRYALSYDVNVADTHNEDYDLWSRALPVLRFANIPEVLLLYRMHNASTSNFYREQQLEGQELIVRRFLSILEMEYSEDDLALHKLVSSYKYSPNLSTLYKIRSWLKKIAAANEKSKIIHPWILKKELNLLQRRSVSNYFKANILLIASKLFSKDSAELYRIWQAMHSYASKIFSR